jgi:drug/metabolite transporter (DMT)-like permease
MTSAFGIVLAALASWSLLLVVSRVILTNTGFDPWIFTFLQMMAGGLFLMLVSGRPRGFGPLLRDPITWIYGMLRVATAAFFTAALLHTSAANAAFLALLSVPTAAIVVWGVMGRRPRPCELPGHFLILLGLLALAGSLEDGFRNPALVFMILSELCVVASTLIAEVHPVNQTEDRRQRAALTGAMLLASACVMLLCAVGIGAMAQISPGVVAFFPGDLAWIRDPWTVLDPGLWLAAGLVGVLLRGPSMLLALKAIHRVETTNYLAGMAALPLTAVLFEAAAASVGWLDPITVWTWSTAFGLIMIVGSLAVVTARAYAPVTPPKA